MKEKLCINDEHGHYRITWWFEDSDDYGGSLGDDPKWESLSPSGAADDSGHDLATLAVKDCPGRERDSFGFFWETRSGAAAALKVANAALKNKPLNEHERWCLAAGWKPPKGRM